MTEKQEKSIRTKIAKIRMTLAAEKRKFGIYDDGRGIRYIPTSLYIKIGDFKGGLTYLKWFNKNFSDDSGLPGFLFEWTIILFKTGNLELAEKKAFETYCSNTYVLDKFLAQPFISVDKSENSNIEEKEYTEYFNYSFKQEQLLNFSEWLKQLMATEKFKQKSAKFIKIHKQLKIENDTEKRGYLIRQSRQLEKY